MNTNEVTLQERIEVSKRYEAAHKAVTALNGNTPKNEAEFHAALEAVKELRQRLNGAPLFSTYSD